MADRTVRVRVLAEMPGYAALMRAGAADTALLGESAVAAGRGVQTLGVDAAAARGGLAGLATGARGTAAAVGEADAAALAAGRGLRGVRGETVAATGAFGRIGASARSGLSSVRAGAAAALEPLKHLGLLLAGGAIIYGLHDIVHLGNEYTDSMNKFLEVTRASGAQMQAAGREAQALGADMKLPSANAAEAANAMVDLAKAGLGAEDAIKAARGTIQLAAAARTDVATAAQIEGDIMDQFALKSSEAAHVADVLANTSNSASGQLMDIYYAMKYVGPIAHTMGISIKDTATAVGLLGKSGIIGETAGTALRSALVNMAKPTRLAKKGLHELGIEAFDSQGNFKGLSYVITQLGNAQKTMSVQQFTAAAAMAFGKPALAAMVALAHQGGPAFQQYGIQVGRIGGAAALAAAESKGLGGAMRGLGKQITSAFLQVYLGISPVLEKITRGMTSSVSSAIPYIKRSIRTATDLWDIYGPAVEKKIGGAAAGVGRSAAKFVDPLKAGLAGLTLASIPLAVSSVNALDKAFHNAGAAVDPLVGGLHSMATSVSGSAGAVGVLAGRLQVGVGALGGASAVLRPLGEIVGGLAHAFGGLPGPIQLSVISMLAMRQFRPQIQGMQNAVVGFGRAGVTAFRGIGDASLYQRVQAANAGVTLGRFGGAMAELERRSPSIAAMGTAFRGVTSQIDPAATGMARFGGTLRGLGTAGAVGALRGLRSTASSLMGAFGGPWGLAIGGAMMALDYFSRKSQAAKQAVREFTQSIEQDSGALGANTRALVAQKLSQAGALDTAAKYHIQLGLVEQAALGNTAALDQVNAALIKNGASYQFGGRGMRSMSDTQTRFLPDAQKLKDLLGSTNSTVGKAALAYKNQKAAIAGATSATTDATNPTARLKTLIDTLGSSESDATTRATALHQAIDLLSGGELDVEAAVAQQNQALIDLNSTYKDGVDKAKGYRAQLLQVDGSLNTTSQNGQDLWNKLQELNTQTAAAAQASYDYARANGTAVVPALQQAEQQMQMSWVAAVKAGEAYGLNTRQAQRLAAAMGFIPSSLAITMSTPGLSDTQKQLLYVQGLAGHLSAGSTIKVTALTSDAVKALESVGVKIRTMPGGRQMEITAPTAKAQAQLNKLMATRFPDLVVKATASTAAAITELENLKRRLAGVPSGHSITVTAPSAMAIQALKDVGYKVKTLPNGKITISVPTGSAAARIAALQKQIRDLRGTTVTVTTNLVTAGRTVNKGGGRGVNASADGNIFRAFADGGTERHIAQITPAGSWRMWGEPETGGESYIPLAPAKRQRSRSIAEETVRMLGGKGIAWYASGAVIGSPGYTPSTAPVLGSPTDAKSRYDNLTGQLTSAWGTLAKAMDTARTKAQSLRDAEQNLERVRSHKHTEAQLLAAEKSLRNAREASTKATSAVAADRRKVNSLDQQLGLRAGAKAPAGFDLSSYQKLLGQSLAQTTAWRTNLGKVARRGGTEVHDILEGMGQDGYALTRALAKASDRQFRDIVAKLKATAGVASASLADFNKQIGASNQQSAQFSKDLQALAAKGYGALAQALAAQGDSAAQSLAHQAATGSAKDAAKANATVTASTRVLSGQDLTDALVLLTTLRGGTGRGYAELIAAGLTTDTIKALVPKIIGQINGLPVANRAAFLKQWAGQGGAPAMADGGILNGRAPVVIAGERGVESYIPLNGSTRSLGLLAQTAAAMGYRLMPAGRWAGVGGGHSGDTHIDRSQSLHLHGAHQTLGEQRADLLRHMQFTG